MNTRRGSYEVKKYMFILTSVVVTFIAIVVFFNNNYINKQKQEYIDIIGSVTAKAVELDPSLEKELIPLITKDISNEDKLKGESFLKEYGITNTLNSSLFPNYNKNNSIIFITVVFAISLVIFNYVQLTYIFKKIKRLTLAANKILDDEYSILITEGTEGDLSKLSLAFSNVRSIIKNNLFTMEKEKKYLVEVLQNTSHQLKTRISTMLIYNDILLNRKLTEEQRENFTIENGKQINKMSEIIFCILKLAKLDASTIEFQKSNRSLNQTIEEVVSEVESLAKEKKIKLEINKNDKINMYHDSFWIQEAITNIIKNAVDHTPVEGHIYLSLIDNPAYYKIIIKDTGTGINQEDIPNIFNRFYKAKNSNKSDSIGIGLAISKAIIEDHNGYIDVNSELGIGTSFNIIFLKE